MINVPCDENSKSSTLKKADVEEHIRKSMKGILNDDAEQFRMQQVMSSTLSRSVLGNLFAKTGFETDFSARNLDRSLDRFS